MPTPLPELARIIGADSDPLPDVLILGPAPIREAGSGHISFVTGRRYVRYLSGSRASAVVVPQEAWADELRRVEGVPPLVSVADPADALRRILVHFNPPIRQSPAEIHASAVVSSDAQLGEEVSVGPHAVIEPGATVGDRSEIGAGCYIGARVTVGSDCRLFPNVVLREGVEVGDRVVLQPGAVVGSAGFGYASGPSGHRPIPQVGGVHLGDDVDVGANSTIDRATMGSTRVGAGTKIDNLVMLGHNVEIGEHGILCAQAGVAGSSELGEFVTLAAQSGVTGHVSLGNGATVGGQSGVTRNLRPGEVVFGTPARPHREAMRSLAAALRVPELLRAIRRLEARVEALEQENRELASDDRIAD